MESRIDTPRRSPPAASGPRRTAGIPHAAARARIQRGPLAASFDRR